MDRIVTTGTFDGLHRGHRLLLDSLRREGERRGSQPLVVTFDRHPLAMINPTRAPHILMLPGERDARLRSLGYDVAEVHFDEQMRRLTAEAWMRRLRDEYGATAVMLGYDNTFGCDGTGLGIRDYEELGRGMGVEVLSCGVEPGVSSSDIRRALAAGDIAGANAMLGYDWTLRGNVVHGREMGRDIGFRTANLSVDSRLQLPGRGVYATMVTMPDGTELPAVTNIGMRPTFGEQGPVSVETHIPGFAGDLYGAILAIRPVTKIRDEERFKTIGDLRLGIERDVARSLEILNSCTA